MSKHSNQNYYNITLKWKVEAIDKFQLSSSEYSFRTK